MEVITTITSIIEIVQLISQGYQFISSIVDPDENGDGGGTIFTVGTDGDGDGEFDNPIEFFLPSTSTETVVEKSIIIVSPDGTMMLYDENGNLTAEDCDTAYSLWVSENGIMNKPLDNYTVTEGLLLIAGIVACFGFVAKIFRRRKVM